MGTLYVVATPIGNLEDITMRALRILREVALIAAEDTRTSRVLLNHYDINTQLTSFHEHTGGDKLESILSALAVNDVALISDAGTPTISDPGYELIREAIARDYAVVPIPGASAVISALVASGLPTDHFTFIGFLPKKQSARRETLATLKSANETTIAYESPHRLADTLGLICEVLGDERPVVVAREITKMFEEFFRGTAVDAHAHFSAENPRGEITLLIGGAPDEGMWDTARVKAELTQRLNAGESLSRAAKQVAAVSGWKKSDVYELGIQD